MGADKKQYFEVLMKPSKALYLTASWLATLCASSFPFIVWRVFLHHNTLSLWVPAVQFIGFGVSIALALLSSELQSVRGFILALLAMAAGDWIRYGIENTQAWVAWAESEAQYKLIVADSFVAAIPAFLMALTLIRSGIGRGELFMQKGNLNAPSKTPFGLRSIPWMILGPIITILFSLPLVLQLTFTVNPNFAAGEKVFGALPVILIFSVFNAACEEFRFRAVLIARSERILGLRQALLLTSTLFGLGHWFGHPSGLSGVVMAGIAGWIWGKAMIETRGLFWSWFIHGIQDILILALVIMADH